MWADAVQAFATHRLYCRDAFRGFPFQEMAEQPPGHMTVEQFVRCLSDNYPTILRNLSLEHPASSLPTAEEALEEEEWLAARSRPKGNSLGATLGVVAVAAAALALFLFLHH